MANGDLVTVGYVNKVLADLLKEESPKITAKAFRPGLDTILARQGATPEELKVLGRWTSIRPWDWSALVILRVSHECGYFSGCSSSRVQQKRILEEYINECLFKGRSRVGQGSPP